ncbi:MAG: pyridoxal phosphate-dependent aminotransferase [Clostridiales bacterium]|nr:pyridoxal phosphate-dependent aminotransferase [Candidatus Coliplasma caballi]
MANKRMLEAGNKKSAIRELYSYGLERAEEIGKDNVFDYSLGNPNVPPPKELTAELERLLKEEDSVALHGYTPSIGDTGARASIAGYLNRTYGLTLTRHDFVLTCGAAAGLAMALHALVEEPGDEVVVFAPFFPEYRLFAEQAGGKLVVVPTEAPEFAPDADALAKAITPRTKVVILNNPNNPTGAVYSEKDVKRVCEVLEKCGHPVWLLSDEPYRDLVFEGDKPPFLTKYYARTLVCFSYSKVLSIPGERIGYLLVNPAMPERDEVLAAVIGAARALGYVCAPTLWQRVLPAVQGVTSDLSVYRENGKLLYDKLTSLGFSCVRPRGAFYLFVKAPGGDARAFSELAKRFELLLVPSDSFGVPGYVRLAYCVKRSMIERSFTAFEKLALCKAGN